MPAVVSSLMSRLVDQPTATGAVDADVIDGDLLAALGRVVDPRARRGVRHRLAVILALGAGAVLAGARSLVAIAEWASDLPPTARTRLGIGRAVPCESTIRRTLQSVDADAFDAVLGDWLAARASQTEQRWPAIAVDGKTVRGARVGDGRAPHLLAAIGHADGVVLAQRAVDGKTNEITEFAPLLDGIDLTGVVVTADALHTQREHAAYLIGRSAHYLFTVKRNQPKLHAQLASLPWAEVPVADTTVDKAHGRLEHRTLKVTAVAAGISFPHAATVAQIVRKRRPLGSRRWQSETVYVITDLDQAGIRPDEIADLARGHWCVENKLH